MLPEEYINFYLKLKEKDLFLGENSYIVFINPEETEIISNEYSLGEYLKGHLLFATNGAGTGYTISKDCKYFEVDLNSLFEEDAIYISDNLKDFISYLEEY